MPSTDHRRDPRTAGDDALQRVLSEQLAYYLPTPRGAKVLDEQFSVTLEYEASPERTDFLVRQIALNGAVTGDEPPAIKRTLELSSYDETVAIETPAG